MTPATEAPLTDNERLERDVALSIAKALNHAGCVQFIPAGQCPISDGCDCLKAARAALAAIPEYCGRFHMKTQSAVTRLPE
jgi:hypothetical protein